jgi:outer membrane receptor protein involved in Fe transport
LEATNPTAPIFTLNHSAAGGITNVVLSPVNPNSADFSDGFRSQFITYSAELQQIWQREVHTLIVGGRYQKGDVDTTDRLTLRPLSAFSVNYNNPTLTSPSTDLDRANAYAYYLWQVVEPLQLTAGVSYDHVSYPVNTDYPPLSDKENDRDQWSPKAGAIWSPGKNTTFRAAYTRSLGGLFYDNSVRLEPTQLAGFTQAYRSLIPESVVGPIPGARFETFGAAWDQKFSSRTYAGVIGEILKSKADRTIGAFDITGPLFLIVPPPALATPSGTRETFDFEEKSLTVYVNQLLNEEWALGGRYRLSHADLADHFSNIPSAAGNNPSQDVQATLNQLDLYLRYQHPCGFFSQFDAVYSCQSNRGYSPDLPGDDFWQFHIFAGYRFLQRRAEVRLGVLNLTDRNYRLNPLTLYSELPRERMFTAGLKFYF